MNLIETKKGNIPRSGVSRQMTYFNPISPESALEVKLEYEDETEAEEWLA